MAISLILLATIARLMPHAWNFTPLTAILLFSAYAFKGAWKLIIPFSAIIVSDFVLEIQTGYGFHSGSWVIYLSYALILLIGHLNLSKISFGRVISSSLLASILFYLITNFAFFYPEVTEAGQMQGYTHNWAGIIGSYTAGIPFFRNMLLGDLLFTGAIFTVYQVVSQRFLKPQF